MLGQIIKNKSFENIVRRFARSALQQKYFHESAAELIKFPGNNLALAITMDSLVEEIETGIYGDPYLIGWMTVMANASDLAAIGASPLGIIISQTFLPDISEAFKNDLQHGIEDACKACYMSVLGGDSHFSSRMEMTGCAIGLTTEGPSLTRIGCRPGDYLFISGNPGQGNAFAMNQLTDTKLSEHIINDYRPQARLKEGCALPNFAGSCIDSANGVFAALDQLSRLNKVGFRIELELENFLHPQALAFCQSEQYPLWLMLAGNHGEFELIFSVAPEKIDMFLEHTRQIYWEPILMGEVSENPHICFLNKDKMVSIDTGRIRNLFSECHGDGRQYIKKLLELDKLLKP